MYETKLGERIKEGTELYLIPSFDKSEIIKSNRIMDIDDAVIHEGFADFLRIAYDGNLTLDEYVLLIENSCWARSYKCDLPLPIDWKKVQTGIDLRIAEIKKASRKRDALFIFDISACYLFSAERSRASSLTESAFAKMADATPPTAENVRISPSSAERIRITTEVNI